MIYFHIKNLYKKRYKFLIIKTKLKNNICFNILLIKQYIYLYWKYIKIFNQYIVLENF